MQMFIGEEPPKGGIPGDCDSTLERPSKKGSGPEKNLKDAWSRGLSQGPGRRGEREDGGKKGLDIDAVGREELEGGFEPPAARPDDRDLVHDERRRVEAREAAMGRLPDDRPARADEGDRPSDPARRARGLHDEIERAVPSAGRAPEERDVGTAVSQD